MKLPFWLVNVFGLANDFWSGNALAVCFPERALSVELMKAIAVQFNLAETVFLEPGHALATLRIFTRAGEMQFAGHPTLGTCAVLHERAMISFPGRVETRAGQVDVQSATNGRYSFTVLPAKHRPSGLSVDDAAAMLGLGSHDMVEAPLWSDAGAEQLLVAVRSTEALRSMKPNATLIDTLAQQPAHGQGGVYAWTHQSTSSLEVRFFNAIDGALVEDAATGSAAANLASVLSARGTRGELELHQGAHVNRPSVLNVGVTEHDASIGGLTRIMGHGELQIV